MDWLIGKVGLDGHVRRNQLRVLLLFVGFQIAAQIALLPLAALATLFFDYNHLVLLHPGAFLLRYPPLIAVGASALFLMRWWRVPEAVGARLAARAGTPACRRLQRLVQELAVLNGMAEPKIVVVDSSALNAFAAGMNARNATIIVTSGLEATLSDAELKAVLAHEMAHLLFGDTRVMAASAIMVETLDGMRRFTPWKNGLGWKSGLLLIFLPPLVMIGMMLSALSTIADTLVRATRLIVAASREMIADAEAIRMTCDPAALVSALTKIDGRSGIGTFPRAIEAMMIDGLAAGPEATHPTIADRIRTIAELTSAQFPLPAAAATAAARPRRLLPADAFTVAAPAGGLFGFGRPRRPGLAERLIAPTAFGRVREGQGKIVKKTRGFHIATFGLGLLMVVSIFTAKWQMSQFNAREAARQSPPAVAKAAAAIPTTRDGVFRYESRKPAPPTP
jgi:heat shock protein HtpX